MLTAKIQCRRKRSIVDYSNSIDYQHSNPWRFVSAPRRYLEPCELEWGSLWKVRWSRGSEEPGELLGRSTTACLPSLSLVQFEFGAQPVRICVFSVRFPPDRRLSHLRDSRRYVVDLHSVSSSSFNPEHGHRVEFPKCSSI